MTSLTRIAVAAFAIFCTAQAWGDQTAGAPSGQGLELPPKSHWVWVSDPIMRRGSVIDLDTGRVLGRIGAGEGGIAPVFPWRRAQIYLPSTFYSRGVRGQRTDVVEIFDLTTLAPVGEVVIPPKRVLEGSPLAQAAITDDDRFIAVANAGPDASLSIVDLAAGAFVGEIATPSCRQVYGGGRRRFFSLCYDGTALGITLDDGGREAARSQSAVFFDPKADPPLPAPVRSASMWYFATASGKLYPVDGSTSTVGFGEPWSVIDGAGREEGWRVGGRQPLAWHETDGRLFVLVRGGADPPAVSEQEVWVYDLRLRKRVLQIPLKNPGVTMNGRPTFAVGELSWPADRLVDKLFEVIAPAAVEFIQVTAGENPLLLTAASDFGSIGVYDARDGQFKGRVEPTGWATSALLAPWGRNPVPIIIERTEPPPL